MNDVSFVYDSIEVIKTGRTATRKLPSGKSQSVVEITPKDQTIASWKKWVNEQELFEISGE